MFRAIDTDTLKALVGVMKQETYPTGTTLFRQGDVGEEMYIILQGKIRIFLEDHSTEKMSEVTFRHYETGEIFGEFALLDQETRSASADVVEPADLLILNRSAFMEFMKTHPTVGLRMMRNLAGRIRYTTTYLQTVVDSTKLMGERKYDEALANIQDSPNPEIHNLMEAFTQMVKQVRDRQTDLRDQLEKQKNDTQPNRPR